MKYLESISIKTKWRLLFGLMAIISLLFYQSTISKTVEVYKKYRVQSSVELTLEQESQINQLTSQIDSAQIMFVNAKASFISHADMIRIANDSLLTTGCTISEVSYKATNRLDNAAHSFNELLISGSYLDLVKGLIKLEASPLGSRIVSTHFYMQQDWSKDEKQLFARVTLKQIANE